jgi:hypothetical protein
VSTRFARLLTWFFGLLGWVILWHLWLASPDLAPWLCR